MAPHGKELSEDLKERIVALHKDGVDQGFSKFTFKGPNLNYHQCQKGQKYFFLLIIIKFYINMLITLYNNST